MTLDDFLQQIEEDCNFTLTGEQLFHIRYGIAQYALAVLDGEVAHADAVEACLEEVFTARIFDVKI